MNNYLKIASLLGMILFAAICYELVRVSLNISYTFGIFSMIFCLAAMFYLIGMIKEMSKEI